MKKMMSHAEISSLCLELSMLLHAGVSLGDALVVLAEESDVRYAAMLSAMAQQIDEGRTLSAALRSTGSFPDYVCGLVEVGERSGKTEEALSALAEYYEGRTRLDRRIRSALLYPAVMLVLMLVVIAVLLTKVLPIFDEVYASLGGRLTGVAGGLLALGRGLDAAMPVLWAVLALVVLVLILFAVLPGFRAGLRRLWQRIAGDRGISKKLNSARLAQALSMGMTSGMAPEEALTLAAGLLEGASAAADRCTDCRGRLERGETLGRALNESGVLPAGACRLLELGQRSGSGDVAMAKIARDLAEESEAGLEERVGWVEPVLVLVCSILVGLILLSVMLPLMYIMTAIG